MSRPWLKWYPKDWRADSRLRMCSLAARGLWIELIGYMHEAEPYGHLLINEARPKIEDIAALVGRPLAEVRKAMAELAERDVFSTDESGSIYSRRMVRDKAKAEKDRENGKGGGNPNLKDTDNGGVNPPDNGGDKAHIPEARSQKEREDAPDGAPARYEFESGVIRLNKRDFDRWRTSFPNLDLRAELIGLTQWAGEQRDWFFAVSGALAKRNRDMSVKLAAARAAGSGAKVLTPSGNPWPEGIT